MKKPGFIRVITLLLASVMTAECLFSCSANVCNINEKSETSEKSETVAAAGKNTDAWGKIT